LLLCQTASQQGIQRFHVLNPQVSRKFLSSARANVVVAFTRSYNGAISNGNGSNGLVASADQAVAAAVAMGVKQRQLVCSSSMQQCAQQLGCQGECSAGTHFCITCKWSA
jgi:hypothetical protein